MPSKKSVERNLPPQKNEEMLAEVDATVLTTKCRVQDVRFGANDEEGTTETFVRIKTLNPETKSPHFIMRKARDDYISATSMYRAVFYKSSAQQEKNEMEVIKHELAARADDNASGVWIPGTPDALQLADVYGIRPWVQALLNAPTDKSAYSDELLRSPSSGPRSSPAKAESTPVPATPSRTSSRQRSASPRKTVAASARKVEKIAKNTIETIAENVDQVKEKAEDVVPDVKKTVVSKAEDLADRPISAPQSVDKAVNLVKNLVKPDTATTNGDAEPSLFSATVTSAGESMADMVAAARAQVEAAERKDASALTQSGLTKPKRKTTKRQAKEIAQDEHETSNDADIKDQSVNVKRSRVEDLEVGLVQEKRKVRALFGLVIGLGATAILPYLL